MATWKDIDLGFLEEENVVVNCRTKEGLSSLVTAIYKQYPDSKDQLNDILKMFNGDYNYGNGMAIRLLTIRNGKLYFGYCDADWYKIKGYKVIELCDITHKAKDLGALDTGHMDVNAALAALF